MDGLTIGAVAKQANVRIETLRYYERQGLIARPPRSRSLRGAWIACLRLRWDRNRPSP